MTSGALSVERLTRGDLTVVPDLIRDPGIKALLGGQSMDPGSGAGVTGVCRPGLDPGSRYSGLLKGSESMDPGSGAGVTSLKRCVYQGKSLIKCSMNKT
jgi:hypothetical protein